MKAEPPRIHGMKRALSLMRGWLQRLVRPQCVRLNFGMTDDGFRDIRLVSLDQADELLRNNKLSGTEEDLGHLRSLISSDRTPRKRLYRFLVANPAKRIFALRSFAVAGPLLLVGIRFS